MSKTVAVVGASADRRKFGNKAVRAFLARGYRVVPIHPQETEVERQPAYRSLRDVPFPIDLVSLYVPPAVGERVVEEVAATGAREVWLNPGSDTPALVARVRELGLEPVVGCSILAIGESPSRY